MISSNSLEEASDVNALRITSQSSSEPLSLSPVAADDRAPSYRNSLECKSNQILGMPTKGLEIPRPQGRAGSSPAHAPHSSLFSRHFGGESAKNSDNLKASGLVNNVGIMQMHAATQNASGELRPRPMALVLPAPNRK